MKVANDISDEGTRILIRHISEGIQTGSLSSKHINSLSVSHDTREGKNLITVSVDGELLFSYDSNFKGNFKIENHIQKPI